MKFGNKFVELEKGIHDRISFDCGEEELNSFLKTQAVRHMKAGVSKTFVLQAPIPLSNNKYPIRSYFTVSPSSIKKASLPAKQAKKLPHYPVPVFLLAQLAVHKDCQGQNLGKITLIKALEFLWEINSQMTAFAIIVDCLNQNVEQFYTKYGFHLLYSQNGKIRMFIPMKTVVELFQQPVTKGCRSLQDSQVSQVKEIKRAERNHDLLRIFSLHYFSLKFTPA